MDKADIETEPRPLFPKVLTVFVGIIGGIECWGIGGVTEHLGRREKGGAGDEGVIWQFSRFSGSHPRHGDRGRSLGGD